MASEKPKDTIRYRYKFSFSNGTQKDFQIVLDTATLELVTDKHGPKPAWTKLKYHQCENCPLGDEVEYCPVAVNLAGLVETFKDSISFERTFVRVETKKRTFEAQTTLQEGLSSVVGVYMVTSNCPVMDQLRPMVRFHLPFASDEETIYRSISNYLTAQYFRMRRGEEPDWELKKLPAVYHAVSVVNQGMSRRVSEASTKDANVNAVIHLATQGQTMDNFFEDSLKEIEYMFSPTPKPQE